MNASVPCINHAHLSSLLEGKVAIVTGSNSGIGFEVALTLAAAGAEVILAARNAQKSFHALDRIYRKLPDSLVFYIPLDLANLKSIEEFAEIFGEQYDRLDILVNNAGVAGIETRQLTDDGFELHFGTNHLGHFALTARLLPYLASCPGSARVVTVSSRVSRSGKISLEDLNAAGKYKAWRAYKQSKLANLLFAFELQRLSDENGWGIMSVAAHPGFAQTNLFRYFDKDSIKYRCLELGLECGWAQTAAEGAAPITFAAIDPSVEPGGYYGPSGCFELKGKPKPAKKPKKSLNPELAKELWEVSLSLTGVQYLKSIDLVGLEDAVSGQGAGEVVKVRPARSRSKSIMSRKTFLDHKHEEEEEKQAEKEKEKRDTQDKEKLGSDVVQKKLNLGKDEESPLISVLSW